jgi:hypothetical protein
MDLPSPYANVLGTNYAPTEAELYDIRSLCSRKLDEIYVLDKDIDVIQKTLDNLLDRRQKLQGFVDTHQALISPIRRLFPELLQLIFKFCLPANNSPMHSKEAPMLLGRICSGWRALAYSTPDIWSSVHVVVPPRESPLSQLRHDALTDWLARSGSVLLSISINAQHAYDPPPNVLGDPVPILFDLDQNNKEHPIVTLIIPHILRCVMLGLCVRAMSLHSLFSREKWHLVTAPLLRRLEIATTAYEITHVDLEQESEENKYSWLASLTQSRHLTEFSYFGRGVEATLPRNTTSGFSYASLTHLRLLLSLSFSASQLLHLLSHCSSLQYLEVVNVLYSKGIESPTTTSQELAIQGTELVTLPHLTHLSICDNTNSELTPVRPGDLKFLDHLLVPSLQQLYIDFISLFSFKPYPLRLITKSGCSLRKLRTCFSSTNAESFVDFLAECPLLTALIVKISFPVWGQLETQGNRDDGRQLISLLTDPNIVRYLEDLTIVDTRLVDGVDSILSANALAPFLRGRLAILLQDEEPDIHNQQPYLKTLVVRPPEWELPFWQRKGEGVSTINFENILPTDVLEIVRDYKVKLDLQYERQVEQLYVEPNLGVELSQCA